MTPYELLKDAGLPSLAAVFASWVVVRRWKAWRRSRRVRAHERRLAADRGDLLDALAEAYLELDARGTLDEIGERRTKNIVLVNERLIKCRKTRDAAP